jgi:NitT/TauT family transport system substrate-binding protein
MRFTRVGRASIAAAASLAITVLAAACSSSGSTSGSGTSTSAASSPSSSKLETTHIVVGALPVVDTAGLYLALKNGYFKQAGLDVTVTPIQQSTAALPDMLHGTVDIVAGANYVSWFQAQAKGAASLKVLASGTVCTPTTFGVLALPSSHITKPADLAGKTIAVNLTNNVQTLTANIMLKAASVNPSSVHYVVIPFPDMITALTAHRVDAISAVEPFATGAKAAGAQMVMSECQGPTASFPLSGYFATSSWVQSHPNTARAFQQALEKGQAYAGSNPQSIRSILPTYTKITSAAAAKLDLNTYPSTLDAAPMQRIVSLMVSGGMLTKPLDVNSLLLGS